MKISIKTVKQKFLEKDGAMYGRKNFEDSIAMLYHENSKLTRRESRTLGEKIGGFNNNPYIESWVIP